MGVGVVAMPQCGMIVPSIKLMSKNIRLALSASRLCSAL